MEDIGISAEEGPANPPCNPDLKICKNKNCMLCFESCEDEFNYGKLYEFENIVAHYYCLLLSSNMQQRGEDTEGIFGFLPLDIRKEIARGRNLRCYYCKNKGATIGCCSSRCKRVFHLPCGRKNDSLHQFFAEFRSYCGDHRPVLNMRKLEIPPDPVCNICLEVFKPKPSISTVHSLLAYCCKKWFHRICIQKFALNSGYFFKCPMCNNKPLFHRGMQDHGIFVPEQDASWELEPGAYRELLDRHNQCDARPCVCPKGKNMNSAGTRWALVLCLSCGSQGMHVRCGNLNFKNPTWECSVCVSAQKRDGDQSDEADAVRSNSEAIVEIEDSDDDIQIISSSSGNEDEDTAIVCIDDEGGSPLHLVKSDTVVATPGGGAISVMTITASDKIPEVVGDLNVVHQQRMPNPSYLSPHIVSIIGGAQVIDDDDDDDDVVIEKDCRKLPDTRTAAERPADVIPPPKRVKTATDPSVIQVPTSAPPAVTSQGSLPLGITRPMQNMIIVSPSNSAVGPQNLGQVQLLSPPQQHVGQENQNQIGHFSIPVAGVDRAASMINLQVMFPPGGMINLVQTPYAPNPSQLAQMSTLQFIQGVFPNPSVPVSSQSSPSVPEPSPLQSNSIPPAMSRAPPPTFASQQICAVTASSSLPAFSPITVSASTSLPSSVATEQVKGANEEDDVQLIGELPPDVSNRLLLKPSRGSPAKRQSHMSVGINAPENDIVITIDTSKESCNLSAGSVGQSAQVRDAAPGECVNTDRNNRLVQNDTVLPGTSSSQQSGDSGKFSGTSGKISGAAASIPNGGIPESKINAEEALGESAVHCPAEATSAASPSSRQIPSTACQRSSSSKRSRNNRAELIPSFIPISDLQFSHVSDSRLKVVVNKEFVIPVNKVSNCFHSTPYRRRSQTSRYVTETRNHFKSSYKPRLLTNSAARNSDRSCPSPSSSFGDERCAMRPISDLKANRPSRTRSDQVASSKKSRQGSFDSVNFPTCSIEGKKPTASGDGQENISPAEVSAGFNVILEKMDGEMFGNDGALCVNNFHKPGGRGRGRKRKYPRPGWTNYSRKKKCHQ